MSKDSREDGAQTVTLEKYPSPDKLTRHMKVFIDRILKGSCPSGTSSTRSMAASSSSKSHLAPSSQAAHVNGISANTITEEDEYEDTGYMLYVISSYFPSSRKANVSAGPFPLKFRRTLSLNSIWVIQWQNNFVHGIFLI